MKATVKLRDLQHRRHAARRRKRLRHVLVAAIDGLALASIARMPRRRRRLAFAAAELAFAGRAHRRVTGRHRR